MQYQYTCRTCGNLRFVEVDPEGMALFMEMEFSPKLICPSCTGTAREQNRYEAMPKVDPVRIAIDRWVPKEYQDNDTSMFPPAWANCRMWIPGKKGLLIYGPTRRCKSRMAYEIVQKAIRLGIKVEAYDCRTFRAAVEKRILDGTLWDWYKQDLEKVPVLLFDDMGKFNGDGRRIEEELFNVVKLRCEAQKSIIVTTNDTPVTLASRFSDGIGGPLIARLLEVCAPVGVYTAEEEAELTQEAELFSKSGTDL